MHFRSLILAVTRYVYRRERHAAVATRYGCGVSDRNLGQTNLLSLFNRAIPVMFVLTSCLLASSLAGAQNGTPAPRPEGEDSLMQLLTDKGFHDIENESWNAYGQFTYISS